MADSCICDAVLSDAIGNPEAMRVLVHRHIAKSHTTLVASSAEDAQEDADWVQVTGLEDWAVVDHDEVLQS